MFVGGLWQKSCTGFCCQPDVIEVIFKNNVPKFPQAEKCFFSVLCTKKSGEFFSRGSDERGRNICLVRSACVVAAVGLHCDSRGRAVALASEIRDFYAR
jgi:hypothetical protein